MKNLLKRIIRFFLNLIIGKDGGDRDGKESSCCKQEPPKVGKWDKDDLICPFCGTKNGVGRNSVFETMPCEHCHKLIHNPRGFTPDSQGIFGPSFEQLDRYENQD